MDLNVMLVLRFDGVYGVKRCSAEFDYSALVGFIRSKWERLNKNNMILTYAVDGYGEGILGDDDDVAFMCSLVRQLSIDRIEISIKEKSVHVVQPPQPLINMPLSANDRGIDGRVVRAPERPLMSMSWANLIKDVGQEFEGGAAEFRKALCKYSVEAGFDFIYVKNERVRVTAVYEYRSLRNCMWRIYASIEIANGFFYIRRFEKHHTCGCSFGTASKRRLTSNIIAELIVNDVRNKPEMVPNDVVVNTKLNYGFDLSYYVAWRAVAAGKEHVFGDETSSYSYLPSYFEELKRNNPGTYYNMEVDRDSMKFQRCFFAIGACLAGFKTCRATLSVDGTFLKAKHQSILLSAIGKDGDNGLFPVAFAIVNEETDSNWDYFLRHLREVIGTDRIYTFLSDRNHDILEGIKNIFPGSFHAYCLVHLQNNLRYKLRGCPSHFRTAMVAKFNACFYAATREEFDKKLIEFERSGGTAITNFLADLPPNKWSCAYFDGVRYGEITSNAAESWNGKIAEIRSLPITNVIDGIRRILMMWMCTRSDDAAKWTSELCYKLNIHVEDLIQQGRVWISRRASDSVYEVICDSNLGYEGIDKHLHTDYYRKTYSQMIYPFVQPQVDMAGVVIGAPEHHIRRGRPRTKRIASRGESIARRMKCSRCQRIGNHNKKTCRAPVA